MKPSEQDEEAFDGDVDVVDDLPYGAAFKLNNAMSIMIAKLEDNRDFDWLPTEERKKLAMRQKGN